MKRRQVLLLLALAAVAAGLLLFWPRGPKEPVYQGKRLSEWIKSKSGISGIITNSDVDIAIRSIGTNALPWLISEFTRPRSKWRATWNRWASTLPVVDLRFKDDEERVHVAGWGLCLLGPDAAPALSTMARYLGDTDRGRIAVSVMATVGDPALPWLLNAVASTNPLVSQLAMDGVVWMAKESESEPAFQALINLLSYTKSFVRMMAAINLRQVVTRPDLTVKPLAAALADPDLGVQLQAALSLREMGYIAQPALPALVRLMTSTNATIASAASNAVFSIDSTALPARGP